MFWKYSSRIAVGQHSLLGHRHWGLQKSWISVFWEWPSPLKHLCVMDVSIVQNNIVVTMRSYAYWMLRPRHVICALGV
jgi:hypothetical protein